MTTKSPNHIELLFDGDIRGYRTGKDCVLELANNGLWLHSLTTADIAAVESESECYLDIVDSFIDDATCKIDGQIFTLHWNDGSIFAISDQATEQELSEFYGD